MNTETRCGIKQKHEHRDSVRNLHFISEHNFCQMSRTLYIKYTRNSILQKNRIYNNNILKIGIKKYFLSDEFSIQKLLN